MTTNYESAEKDLIGKKVYVEATPRKGASHNGGDIATIRYSGTYAGLRELGPKIVIVLNKGTHYCKDNDEGTASNRYTSTRMTLINLEDMISIDLMEKDQYDK